MLARPTALALACLLVLTAAACDSGQQDGQQPSVDELQAIASEAVRVLDEAAAMSGAAVEEAEEAVSEAIQQGALGLASPPTVRVGTDLDFMPFEGVVDGEAAGFDVELFDEICRRLSLEPEYVDEEFPRLIGNLAAGELDVVMSAVSITPERDEVIDFSRPYFVASQGLGAGPGSELSGVSDLDADTKVAVLEGTTGEAYAVDNLPPEAVVVQPDRASAVTALQDGSVAAVLLDLDAVAELVQAGTVELVEEVATGERYGIAIPEGNVPLRAALNLTLGQVFDDGTYATLFQEWFPTRDVDLALTLLG